MIRTDVISANMNVDWKWSKIMLKMNIVCVYGNERWTVHIRISTWWDVTLIHGVNCYFCVTSVSVRHSVSQSLQLHPLQRRRRRRSRERKKHLVAVILLLFTKTRNKRRHFHLMYSYILFILDSKKEKKMYSGLLVMMSSRYILSTRAKIKSTCEAQGHHRDNLIFGSWSSLLWLCVCRGSHSHFKNATVFSKNKTKE